MQRSRLGFWVVMALLLATAAAVVVGNVVDRQSPQVQALVQNYLDAVSRQDLNAALAQLAPDERDRWRDFVANQLGNKFSVQAISVRHASLLDSWLRGHPPTATSVTIFVTVNPHLPERWQAYTLVRVTWWDGRWYLLDPPLKPSGQ